MSPQNTNMWTLHVFRYVSHVHKRRACPPDLSHTHPHNYYRMSAGWAAGAVNPPVRQISDYFDRKSVWFWLHIWLQTKWRNGPRKFCDVPRNRRGPLSFITFYFVIFFPPFKSAVVLKKAMRNYARIWRYTNHMREHLCSQCCVCQTSSIPYFMSSRYSRYCTAWLLPWLDVCSRLTACVCLLWFNATCV